MKPFFKMKNLIMSFRKDMMKRQFAFKQQHLQKNDVTIEMLLQDAGFDLDKCSLKEVSIYTSNIESTREQHDFINKVIKPIYPKKWVKENLAMITRAICMARNHGHDAMKQICGGTQDCYMNTPYTFDNLDIKTHGIFWNSNNRSEEERFFDILGATPEQYDKAVGILKRICSFVEILNCWYKEC